MERDQGIVLPVDDGIEEEAPDAKEGRVYKSFRYRFITVLEMNQHLEYCFNYRHVHYRAKMDDEWMGLNAFLEDGITIFKLTYKLGDKTTTYVTHLDTIDFEQQQLKGAEAYRIMCKWVKFPVLEYMKDVEFSASPLITFNPKYERQWLYGYYYDLNSAYASVMISGEFPDTTKPPRRGIVHADEIGFDYDENRKPVMVHEGPARWIFPKQKLPKFGDFARHWYDIKKNPKDVRQKFKAKNILNYCVGYLQLTNPFIRAYIVCSCNERMQKIINEYPDDWCLCNTDAVVSLKPLPLDVGPEIGQFKMEEGKFAYRGCNYQFGEELKYRGIPHAWFPEGWDITKDEIPGNNNIFYYDYDEHQIKEVENHDSQIKREFPPLNERGIEAYWAGSIED